MPLRAALAAGALAVAFAALASAAEAIPFYANLDSFTEPSVALSRPLVGSSVTEVTAGANTRSAGATNALYEVSFKATSAVPSGGYIRFAAPAGTVFAGDPNAYRVDDVTSSHEGRGASIVVEPEGGGATNVVDIGLGELGAAIAAGDTVHVFAYGVHNPNAKNETAELAVSTSSDTLAVSKPFQIGEPSALTEVTVGANSRSAGATNSLEEISFKATHAITPANPVTGYYNGYIHLVAPAGTVFPGDPNAFRIVDGSHEGRADRVTVPEGAEADNAYIGVGEGGVTIAAGDTVHVFAYGVHNPSAKNETAELAVSTSSDAAAVSKPFQIGEPSALTEVTVGANSRSAGATNSLEEISFKATHAITPANPVTGYYNGYIHLVAPAGTVFPGDPNAYRIVDGSHEGRADRVTVPGGAEADNAYIGVGEGGVTIAAGDTVHVFAYGVHNPSAKNEAAELAVSTSSDNAPVSKPFAIGEPSAVTEVTVGANSRSAGATNSLEEVSFKATHAITPANSVTDYYNGYIHLIAPAGTVFPKDANAFRIVDGSHEGRAYGVTVPEGAEANNAYIGVGEGGVTIAAGDTVHVFAYGVHNPSTKNETAELAVSTSSDNAPVSKPFPIGEPTAVGDLSSSAFDGSYIEQFVVTSGVSAVNPASGYYEGSLTFTAPSGVELPGANGDYQFAELVGGSAHFEASGVRVKGNVAQVFIGRGLERGQKVQLTVGGLTKPPLGEVHLLTSSDAREASAPTEALAPLSGTVTYKGVPIGEVAVQACPTAGGACVATTTTAANGTFTLAMPSTAGVSYGLTATPHVADAQAHLAPVTIPGPAGLSGVEIVLPASPTIPTGITIISPSHGEETSLATNPVTYWGESYQLKLERSAFPAAKGIVHVTQVIIRGTDELNGEPMSKIVDVGGSVEEDPIGVVLGNEPITVTIPPLYPIHGLVTTSVRYEVLPYTPDTSGVLHPQILDMRGPAEGLLANPVAAFFINAGYPSGVTIGPGTIVGPDRKDFEVVTLASVKGYVSGLRDCDPAGALLERFAGAPSVPSPATKCGIGVKFNPPASVNPSKPYYSASLRATFHSASGTTNIFVPIVACDERAQSSLASHTCFVLPSGNPCYYKFCLSHVESEQPNVCIHWPEVEEVGGEEELSGEDYPECGVAGGEQYVDPSGNVYAKTEHGTVPLAGAEVTLSEAFESGGPLYQVPNGSDVMSPANRVNPDRTDAAGAFGWDVLGGTYAVTASKEGCSSETTSPFEVPPPVSDLSFTLTCATPPALSPTSTTLSSSSHDSAYGEPVTLSATVSGGTTPSGTVTFYEASTPVGSGIVDHGLATATLASLAPGTHSLTASYGGDGANAPSSSSAISQVVIATPLQPEFGRCVKVAQGTGRYKTAACTSTLAEGNYEWKPGVEKAKLTTKATATVTLETVGKTKVVCKGESGSGEYSGSGLKHVLMTFTGCESAGAKCTSKAHGEGEVQTSSLEAELGVDKHGAEAAKDKLGLELFPSGREGLLAEFSCGSVVVKLRGSVIGAITAVDKMAASAKLKLTGAKGKQKPEAFEGGSTEALESSFGGGAFEQSRLTLAMVQTSEEPVEINAVV